MSAIRWRIENEDSESVVRLELIHFATEARVDYLDIVYADGNASFPVRRLTGSLSDAELPRLHFAGPGALELVFSSDASIVAPGFHATFYRLSRQQLSNCSCPVAILTVADTPLRLATPNYTGGSRLPTLTNYILRPCLSVFADGCVSLECHFLLRTETGTGLELVIEEVNINFGTILSVKDMDTGHSLAKFAPLLFFRTWQVRL